MRLPVGRRRGSSDRHRSVNVEGERRRVVVVVVEQDGVRASPRGGAGGGGRLVGEDRRLRVVGLPSGARERDVLTNISIEIE